MTLHVKGIALFFIFFAKDASGSEDMPIPQLCQTIGGEVLAKYNAGAIKNACTIRLSYALNKSGVTVPAIAGQTWSGADGKNYFFRVYHLFNWLSKTIGAPDIHLTETQGAPSGTKFKDLLAGTQNRGIYIMRPKSQSTFRATGHASFWSGLDVFGGNNFFGATRDVYIWKFPLLNF